MKKTFITLIALCGLAMGEDITYDYNGDFSWGADQALTFTFDGASPFSISDLESTHSYKNVSTEGYTGTYSPDVNVGYGGTWTLTFNLNNTTDEAITLTGISVDLYMFNGSGTIQPSNTQRSITLTLGEDVTGSASMTHNSTTEDGSVETYALDMKNHVEIAAGSSIAITLTAARQETETLGTFVGLTGATFSTSTQSIPEPATVTLSLLALCGLAARRRRQ